MLKKLILPAIIIGYLVLATLYAALTPAWQIPDEPAHYNFVRYVAQNIALPELVSGCYDEAYLNRLKTEKFPPELSVEPVCYEHYQPPLYYLLAAPIFGLANGNLLALRLLSVGLGALALVMVYRTVALFLPGGFFPAAVTAFVAFVPMHLAMLAAVNNDSLAELLFVTLIFVLLRWALAAGAGKEPVPLIAGVILGLILLTKVTVYTAVPLAAFILFLGDRSWRGWIRNAWRVYLPAGIIGLPFYLRNSLVYGGLDMLGLRRHDAVVIGQLRTAVKLQAGVWPYLSELFNTVFHSFWGQFGWMAVPMDGRVYLALAIWQGLALVGLAIQLRQWRVTPLPPALRLGLAVMAASVTLAAGVFAGLNFSFVQFQGRYFFSALMPIGVFFSLGLAQIFRRRNAGWGAAVAVVALAGVGIDSVAGGSLDKWGLLISGAALGFFVLRSRLKAEFSGWAVSAGLVALAGLAATSLGWFIVPNL